MEVWSREEMVGVEADYGGEAGHGRVHEHVVNGVLEMM